MEIVANVDIDKGSFEAVKRYLAEIEKIINGSSPQEDKERRIKNILELLQSIIATMILVEYTEAFNG
jgi:hypothetical protein